MGFAREASPSSTGTQRVSLKDIADEVGHSDKPRLSFAINDRLVFPRKPNDESRRLRPNLGGRRSMPRKRWARRKP